MFATGACAVAGTLLAWTSGGQQEDVGSAVGGLVGFALANGIAFAFRGSRVCDESHNDSHPDPAAAELGFAYGVVAVAYFAFVGWLTGHIHDHGKLAGTVCGGLGGFILAIIVPAIHRSSFMAAGRKLQLALSVAAVGAILAIVWAMYKHEFL